MEHYLNENSISRFKELLIEEEKCPATVEKYLRDLMRFARTIGKTKCITKETVVCYKQQLVREYTASTVNGMLASLNSFFKKMEWYDCIVRSLRVQRDAFRQKERELDRDEYYRLLQTARKRGDMRLYYLMETIGSTGIRISELPFITVEAVKMRRVRVALKGKSRVVLLPASLCGKLEKYIKENRLKKGSVFVTKSGKPVNRSNVFRMMKGLCEEAGVAREKVFPHNLRHLFARIYYKVEKDIAHLADILGHSSIETTRIYLMTSYEEQEKKIDRLELVL